MNADILGGLISWADALKISDLPPDVIETSKACLMNTAAAIVAGSAAPGATEVVRQVQEWGGKPESTVAIYGSKLPAPLAALANGVMAHAMDFDDTQVGTGLHANVSIVPALLAASELRPRATGVELLVAHAVGLEVACRMTLAAKNRAAHPWLTTTLFGIFGAAIAAGKLLNLGTEALRHALGIVYSSAGGNRQGLLDGTLIQRIQPGLSAQAALEAVAFARLGVTGSFDVIEGRYGLYPSYYGSDFERQELTRDLGREFRMRDLAFKLYPCCSYSQEPIEAVLHLVHEHHLRPEDVAEAFAYVESEHAAGLVGRPYEPRTCAQVDAQFSMQYVIAAAICRQALSLAEFQEAALRDPAVLALVPRIRTVVEAESAGNISLRLIDGRVLSYRVVNARGHPSRPLRRDELSVRLRQAALYSAHPMTPGKIAGIEDCIWQLEGLRSGAELASVLG